MILISEVVHNGEVHLQFNSCLLEIIGYTSDNQNIVYRSERAHADAVESTISNSENIEFLRFESYYDAQNYSWVSRIAGEIIQIWKSLRLGAKRNASIYIWTCLFPTGHLFLNFCLLFFRRAGHIIVLHGELEMLKTTKRKKTEIILGFFLKCAINMSNRNLNYIVLGSPIRRNLERYISQTAFRRVISILHPYRYNNHSHQSLSEHKPLVFGSIGSQMLSKNSNYIFNLALSFKTEVINGDLQFKTIGKVLPEIEPYKNELVDCVHERLFIPQAVFEEAVSALDFVLFFYDNNSYQLCASGAVFEVIRLGIPVISIYNDYFNWLFQEYGSMGFLCKDVDEMNLTLSSINNGKLKMELEIIRENIVKFRDENKLISIATDLSNKLCLTL